MVIRAFWNENKIITIEKIGEYFYANVCVGGVKEAKKEGLPVFLMKDTLCISKELPYFIKRRIYDLRTPNKTPQQLEMEIIKKIEESGETIIKTPIDKIRISIEI